jgi:hypothetical protein
MSEEKKENQPMINAETAQRIVEIDKRKRADDCGKELKELLAKHKCQLVPFMSMQPNQQPQWGVNIIAD